MYIKFGRTTKGFTLIELLIVIAIIGILSTVVMSALNEARVKARNVARISQLKQIQKALEMYYDDYGSYPNTWGDYYRDCTEGAPNNPNDIVPGLVPIYLPSISSDPTMESYGANHACLNYASNGIDYSLILYNIRDPYPYNYTDFPSFLPPYRDGGGDSCLIDDTAYNSLGVWTEGACSYTGNGSPW